MIQHDTSDEAHGMHVLVIGGGAAGLIAAGRAAKLGAQVVLLEKMRQVGRKLSITGKGRCNLTNSARLEDFIAAYGPQGQFLRQAFMAFFNSDLVAFIRSLGVDLELERGGRYFPADNRAPDITRALYQWVLDAGVEVYLGSEVRDFIIENDRVIGVRHGRLKKKLVADAVILATGGLSYPDTGSTGDGYRLAEEAGHSIVPTKPALVPLTTSGEVAQSLQGLSLRNVGVRLMVDDKGQDSILGEMLFTHYGVSGPIVLQLSHRVISFLEENRKVEISIDLKPALDEKSLEARLLRDFKEHSTKQLHTILKGLLPASLISVCLHLLELPTDVTGSQITTAERRRLRAWLKDFRLSVTGHRSYAEAIVTAGGVALKEVNPRSMESLIRPGLYFAGEVLDIDGPTGGYNLQAAFSTGWLAGTAAAGAAENPPE
jgi:hypothetical protein